MGRSWPWTLRVLFLASLLLLCSALPPPSPPPPRRGTEVAAPDEALLARMCDPRGSPPAWCHELRLRRRRGRRHHHRRTPPVPLPPPGPGRDDGGEEEEEIDMRYGVAKRRVPTGPNPLHN